MHQAARTRALLSQTCCVSTGKAGGRTRRGTAAAGTIRAADWRPAVRPQVGVEGAWSTQRMETSFRPPAGGGAGGVVYAEDAAVTQQGSE